MDTALVTVAGIILSALVTWLVAYVYYRRQRSDSRFLASAERIGLVAIHPASQEFGSDSAWTALVKHADQSVDILAYSFRSTFDNEDLIQQLANLLRDPEFSLRVILANPTSPLVRQRSYSLGIEPDILAKRIHRSLDRLSTILGPRVSIPDRREVRTFSDLIIPYSLLRVDNTMLVMPYLSSSAKRNSPVLIVKGEATDLFRKYDEDFAKVWRRSQPLHNPRVRVPANYINLSSEKELIAQSVARWIEDTPIDPTLEFNALDVGCGDGTQTILTFNMLGLTYPSVRVTALDPSTIATQACEDSVTSSKLRFHARRPILQKMWQEYHTDSRFHLLFCCHVLGAIYQQCGTDEEFRRELERMLSVLNPSGQLCVVLASERSVELQLRTSERQAARQILSAEWFGELLDLWGIRYQTSNITSHLTLEGWLAQRDEQVEPEEKEILHFLFSPFTELTTPLANQYRIGLRSNARSWAEIDPNDRQAFLSLSNTRRSAPIAEKAQFVQMLHVCYWIARD